MDSSKASDVAGNRDKKEDAWNFQEIAVTGTRIKAPNLTSASQVMAVTDIEIKAQGATNIENVLNSIPQSDTAQIVYAGRRSTQEVLDGSRDFEAEETNLTGFALSAGAYDTLGLLRLLNCSWVERE